MSNLKRKVLFVCIHNSARSQMAEAFLNQHGGGHFEAESAGLEPGTKEEILEQTRQVRDEIEQAVIKFVQEAENIHYWL
jgi:protein-tyrosine-phosphatase